MSVGSVVWGLKQTNRQLSLMTGFMTHGPFLVILALKQP
jgi:hypothetical protein